MSRQQVERYNPERKAGETLKASLRRVFYATRATAQTDLDAVGMAHQTYRLRELDRLMCKAKERGNVALVAEILKIATKEVGGLYTNRRGGPERRLDRCLIHPTLTNFGRVPSEHRPKQSAQPML